MKQPSSSHHADLRDANQDRRESSLTSRREFLTSAAAAGIGAVLPASGLIAQVASGGGPKGGLIDVHSHYSSPNLVAAVGQKRLGAAVAGWVPEKSLFCEFRTIQIAPAQIGRSHVDFAWHA